MGNITDFEMKVFSEGRQVFIEHDRREHLQVEVFNVRGENIYRKSLLGGGKRNISLSTEPGEYLVRVFSNEAVYSMNVMIA